MNVPLDGCNVYAKRPLIFFFSAREQYDVVFCLTKRDT